MTAVVGRDRELEEIQSFLELADEAPRVLLLEGEACIGKSTLWRSGVDIARERGYRVLSSTAARSEADLSFTVRARANAAGTRRPAAPHEATPPRARHA